VPQFGYIALIPVHAFSYSGARSFDPLMEKSERASVSLEERPPVLIGEPKPCHGDGFVRAEAYLRFFKMNVCTIAMP
jgi:hypothetical protein